MTSLWEANHHECDNHRHHRLQRERRGVREWRGGRASGCISEKKLKTDHGHSLPHTTVWPQILGDDWMNPNNLQWLEPRGEPCFQKQASKVQPRVFARQVLYQSSKTRLEREPVTKLRINCLFPVCNTASNGTTHHSNDDQILCDWIPSECVV